MLLMRAVAPCIVESIMNLMLMMRVVVATQQNGAS